MWDENFKCGRSLLIECVKLEDGLLKNGWDRTAEIVGRPPLHASEERIDSNTDSEKQSNHYTIN